MKLTDMIVSGLLKRGILYEARNCEMEFEVPISQEGAEGGAPPQKGKTVIKFKAEHMTLRIEKEKE
ncbi:MAG: hypothetical protein N2317_08585 [Syntrophales bacterium]|nr:hypothetical protein [Syntrophales bacterium]